MNDKHFIDWETHIFGFGYGTGEQYILRDLKIFFNLLKEERNYHYEDIEKVLGFTTTWLFINILCKCDVFEYGTSPRNGWLTKRGKILRDYIKDKETDQLYDLTRVTEDYNHCSPDYCNCDGGSETKNICNNPMFDPETR